MKTAGLSKNEEIILNFLADYPEKSFLGSEIAKKNKISAGGAHNALNELREKNFVALEERGRMKLWKINGDNILVKQHRTVSLLNKISKFISAIKTVSLEAILFGSGARGEYSRDSDIDIFILAHDKNAARETVESFQKKYPIKAVIKTPNEWQELEIKDSEFYGEVKRGIKL